MGLLAAEAQRSVASITLQPSSLARVYMIVAILKRNRIILASLSFSIGRMLLRRDFGQRRFDSIREAEQALAADSPVKRLLGKVRGRAAEARRYVTYSFNETGRLYHCCLSCRAERSNGGSNVRTSETCPPETSFY